MAEEETREHDQEQQPEAEQAADDQPQVFAVQKDLAAWRFSRRDFLTAAGAAVGGAVAAGCGPQPTPEAVPTNTPPAPTSAPTQVMVLTRTPTPAPTPKPTRTPTRTPAPTRTPRPTRTPAPTRTPSPTPEPAASAEFLADVTIPDGTVMEPGFHFTKTWRVKNNGSIAWGEGVQVVFETGDQMGGVSPLAVADCSPGDTLEISLDMTAPAEPGEYSGEWSLLTAGGEWLTSLWVAVVVASLDPVPAGQEGVQIQVLDATGQTRTFTLPCGSPIPPGATCICNCVAGTLPGEPGEVAPGQEGINFTSPGGETRTMPCGSPIPDGWTCSCNCVTAPPACGCDGHCSCDSVSGGHYWYPC
jgi:hypothetical protein